MTKTITDSFPRNSSTSFLSWAMDNHETLLNFDERAVSFFEVTQEAIHFLVSNQVVGVDMNGFLSPLSKKVKKTSPIFKNNETNKKQLTSSTLLGKWMVAQEATTVYSILGIRP